MGAGLAGPHEHMPVPVAPPVDVDGPGGQVTISALFASHRLSLVRLAVLLVDDVETAEDIVQDAFAGLHRRWGRLRDHRVALAYLRTAVVNNSRSALRRRRTARRYLFPHQPDAPSAESHVVLADEHREVLAAVQRLPRRQREVLVLRYWSDLGEADIAETLGMSQGTVKSTASRAIAAVATMLEVHP